MKEKTEIIVKMEDEELGKIWQTLDNRITAINNRTKCHTIDIRELRNMVKELIKKKEKI